MIEILGLAVSGIGVMNDWLNTKRERETWKVENLPVDREWLGRAIENGHVTGAMESFAWVREERVPTIKSKGTHQVVFAHNDEQKILYRIVRERRGERNILMQEIAAPVNGS